MKLIDADALLMRIVAKGQRSTRYKWDEEWELNAEEIRDVVDGLPDMAYMSPGYRIDNCPFCGGSSKLRSIDGESYVICEECEAQSARYSFNPRCSSEARAVTAWNRRAEE